MVSTHDSEVSARQAPVPEAGARPLPATADHRASIELTPDLLVARGVHRACYVNPHDRNTCIKVYHRPDRKDLRREQATYRLLERRGIDWRLLSRYFGCVDTNLGPGYVFELIRDVDGRVSRTLEHYLDPGSDEHLSLAQLAPALRELRQYLLDNRVISQQIAPRNLVFQHTGMGNGRLLMIDDIGNCDFIPIRNYLGFMARNRIRRYWRRFETQLSRRYGLDLDPTSGPADT